MANAMSVDCVFHEFSEDEGRPEKGRGEEKIPCISCRFCEKRQGDGIGEGMR